MDPYQLLRTLAFRLEPELAHNLSLKICSQWPLLANLWGEGIVEETYAVELGKVKWRFPVGLAAGLDKNAECMDFFSRLPLGAIEVGTVTPRIQEGNPRPRLFRLIEEESLRNRMGFNNQGLFSILTNVREFRQSSMKETLATLGINLGKNKDTPLEKTLEDYLILYQKFSPVADYLVINISSPNTPGLRDLQTAGFIKELLQALAKDRGLSPCPLYLKLAPEVPKEDLDAILDLIQKEQLAGVIATNTGIFPKYGDGGISGRLLKEKSKEVREYILERVRANPSFDVIGAGGINSFEDLWDFWKAGGKVVQVYTGLIYGGPQLLYKIKSRIDEVLRRYDLKNVTQLLDNISSL